jgi:hypothetical protein
VKKPRCFCSWTKNDVFAWQTSNLIGASRDIIELKL